MYQKITKKIMDPKRMLDVRVSKMLNWIWSNFTDERFNVKFVLGEYN